MNHKNHSSDNEWKEYKLSNAPLKIIDGDRGKNYPSQEEFYDTGDCLFLSTRNVRKAGFDFSSKQYITAEKDGLLRKGKLCRNDIVLTTRGTIGNLAFFNNKVPYDNIRINSGMVIIRPEIMALNPNYCFYLFRGLQKDFETFTSGSAQPQLPIKDLNEMNISLPGLSEQRAIASILSSLDDKIDLLHRQNKTLEQLAETLFRQWFVEEAKEIFNVGDVANVTTGKGLKRDEFLENGEFPILGANGEIGRTNKYLTDEKLILTGRVGTLGKVYIVEGKVWISDNVLIVNPFDRKFFYPIYFYLKTIDFENLNVGSTQPLVTQTELKKIGLKIPNKQLFEEFIYVCTVCFEKISRNKNQIHTLTQLRDILLPKLISGEVRVN
ncbi:MAG: restriction endonuclease subunit S [Ignavibacteriaceae bacterium]